MKRIGITGGIGSGKTTVCEIFKLMGIPVFHADTAAKNIQNSDKNIKRLIINLLGESAYTPDGILDRQKVARTIFNDRQALASMNEIIHPAVRQSFLKWSANYQTVPYILYEAAILFESGYASDFDQTILVLAEENIRIERVIKRDHTTEEIVKLRSSNQMSDIDKVKRADFIVENNENSLLIPQILIIDQLIKEDGKTW